MSEHSITILVKRGNEFKEAVHDIFEKVRNNNHRGRSAKTKAKFKDDKKARSELLI